MYIVYIKHARRKRYYISEIVKKCISLLLIVITIYYHDYRYRVFFNVREIFSLRGKLQRIYMINRIQRWLSSSNDYMTSSVCVCVTICITSSSRLNSNIYFARAKILRKSSLFAIFNIYMYYMCEYVYMHVHNRFLRELFYIFSL